ncbi:MAG: hypothetical protein AAFP70_05185 [Calditrichota bacterium]
MNSHIMRMKIASVFVLLASAEMIGQDYMNKDSISIIPYPTSLHVLEG